MTITDVRSNTKNTSITCKLSIVVLYGLSSVLLVLLMSAAGCQSNGLAFGVRSETMEARMRQVLYQALQSKDARNRTHALECLAHLGGTEAAAKIRKYLADTVPAVRFAAAVAAGDIQDYSARDKLYVLLRDKNISVRMAAAYALEKMGDKRFGNWYDNILAGNDNKLLGQACLLLGKLGNAGIRAGSREKLWHILRNVRESASVQLQAAEALAGLGDKRILKRLMVWANSSYADDRMLAVSGLGLLGGHDAYTMLTVLADDPQIEVRLAAIGAMQRQADKKDLQIVRKALGYKDSGSDKFATLRVRGLAILALGKAGQSKDGSRIYKMMASSNSYLRIAAARACIDYLKRMKQLSQSGDM